MTFKAKLLKTHGFWPVAIMLAAAGSADAK
jgi:hypothetical protein